MELEGNLIVVEIEPARRWVSALVVTLPVLACVAGVTWFIRANDSPPTIQIPSPTGPAAALLADPVQVEPTPPIRAEAPAEPPTTPAQASGSDARVAAPAFPAPLPADHPAPASGMTETVPVAVAVPMPQPSRRPTMAETVATSTVLRPREESAARQPATSARHPPGTRSVRVNQPTYARHGAE